MSKVPAAHPDPGSVASRWLWFLGVAVIVFAARVREFHLHGSEVPYLDQWDAEGRQILVPWLEGKLSWTALFAPHNEHVPVWTRLSAWLQAAWLNRWDPSVQTAFNAALHGVFAGILAGWLRRTLPLISAFGLTLLVVVLASLPFGFENSAWGFQVHAPLALLLVFLHIRGSFTAPPGSTRWWLAQAAGLAALFTYGSMWAAPAAVMLTALWTAAPDRRRWIAGAVLAAGGIGLLLFARARQDPAATLALSAHSPGQFLAAFLHQLGWPSVNPGACVVLWLPAFVLALKLRRNAAAEPLDRIVLALAVWGAAQAAAFAYGRGGGGVTFVPRYGDLLALGVVANGLALWRLAQAFRSWRAWAAAVFALVWLATVAQGLQLISTRGHTEYFHERSERLAFVRREAVTKYLATHDLSHLSTPEVRSALYPNPEIVAGVLDQPGLVDLLPVSLRPNPARVRGDSLSAAVVEVRSLWAEWAASGAVILLLGLWLTRRNRAALAPIPPLAARVPSA